MSALYSAQNSKVLNSETFIIVCKGAPEAVLDRCTSYLVPSSSQTSHADFLNACPSALINEKYVEFISARSSMMASSGLRVLALAIRRVNAEQGMGIINSKSAEASESDLCFVGLIGLIDPPKAGVKESVRTCKAAGIRVIMITGDHIDTANAIARDLGIIETGNDATSRSMKGYEVDMLSEEILAAQNPFPVVFARVSPDNKLKIVRALQSHGESVVMTGDGVNDAPAIKQADVGVAMGRAGTEITKQAADIVLADDNFSTIVEAVKEGRQVYDNIIKFVIYLLSCNSSEVLVFLM